MRIKVSQLCHSKENPLTDFPFTEVSGEELCLDILNGICQALSSAGK